VLEIWSKSSVPESTFARSMFETSSVTANGLNSFSARRTQLRAATCSIRAVTGRTVADLPLNSGGAPKSDADYQPTGTRPGGIGAVRFEKQWLVCVD